MKPRIVPRVVKLAADEELMRSAGWYVITARTSNGPFSCDIERTAWQAAMQFAWVLYWSFRILEKY